MEKGGVKEQESKDTDESIEQNEERTEAVKSILLYMP